MWKREIIALADEMRTLDYVPDDVVDALCRFCSSQNHDFNEQRFRNYLAGKCGPNGGAVTSSDKLTRSHQSTHHNNTWHKKCPLCQLEMPYLVATKGGAA